MHSGFGHRIHGVAAVLDHPAGGAQADDGAAAECLHVRHQCLDGEVLVAEIDRHAAFEIGGGCIGQRVAYVIGGIVDQYRERPRQTATNLNGSLQGTNIGDVAVQVMGWGGNVLQARLQGRRARIVDIQEHHLRTLPGEVFNKCRANAGGTPGHQHRAVVQAGVYGHGHCCAHHSATLPSACRQMGLRQRWPSAARSST